MDAILLHIGDIHFRDSDNPILRRVEEIVAAVRARHLTPIACFVVVPGDIAFSGTADEYRLAEAFFRELLARLEQEYPGMRAEIVFVPGNHDCDLALASDIRRAGQIRDLLENVEVGGAYVREYLAVQDQFFEFAAKFGQHASSTKERLLVRRVFAVGANTVAVTCINTAWLTENPEKPGTLFFPTQLFLPLHELTADVEIAMLHHPDNWLIPANAQAVRQALEGRADIILTGHEHHFDTFTKQRPEGVIEFVAGQAMFDPSVAENGFNVIRINIESHEWRLETLLWNGQKYVLRNEMPTVPFLRNKVLSELGFVNSPKFAEELNDIGTGFTHSKKELRLSDLFVYPTLSHRSLQVKLDGRTSSPKRILAKDVAQFIATEPRLLILGAGKAGKTSLARTTYRLLQGECKMVPVLIDAKSIVAVDQLPGMLDAAYSKQYSRDTLEAFRQLPSERRALIIDNLEDAPVARKTLARAIEDLGRRFGKIVVFADERFDIDHVVNAPNLPIFLDYRQYYLEELNRVLRGKLIRRWVSLGRSDLEDEQLHREVESREKIIDTLLGRQLVPAHPIFVLGILQALDAARNLNTASGSYGELYEALITDRLASVSRKATDLGTRYTLISRIAYFLYQRDVESFTAGEMETLCDDYFADYQMRIEPKRLIEDLVTAELIREVQGNYSFKYAYYYHFFVARYFRDNLQEPLQGKILRDKLEEMADRVYSEAYTNIVVFYLYLTKDIPLIERILGNAEKVYCNYAPATLEADAQFINSLYVSAPKPVLLPGTDVEENRDYVREQMDAAEQGNYIVDKIALSSYT